MGLFSKIRENAGKKKVNPVVEAINQEAQKAQETQQTNQELANARATLEEIKRRLNELKNNTSLWAAMKMSAEKNDTLIRELSEAEKRLEQVESEGSVKKRAVNIFELERDLYITSDSLDSYVNALDGLFRFFNEKGAAEAVETGANRINVYLDRFINSLDEALRSGKKYKANACIDVLKYTLVVGYKKEDISDPEQREEVMNEKIDFVSNICTELLATIDEYYRNIAQHKIKEAAYLEAYNRFIAQYEKMEEIPDDIKIQIESLGFKRAIKDLPTGHAARQYFPVIMAAQSSSTDIASHSLSIEALLLQLSTLRNDIKKLLIKCEEAYESGVRFDYNKHKEIMTKIRDRSIADANRMNDMAAEAQRMNEETISLINEAAENEQLAGAISNSMKTIAKQANQIKRNEELSEKIKEKRAAVQKEQEEKVKEAENLNKENNRELIEEMI